MPRYQRTAILGLLTGAVAVALSFTPIGRTGEDGALYWLFTLRGPIDPPPDVVVVSTHPLSAREPSVTGRTAELPRSAYARLIDQLVREGASVIVLDVAFDKPGPAAEDRALASAIRRAGRVVLFQIAHRETFDWGWTVRLVPPIPELADAAVGIAPHALPKIPARVSQVWTFMPAAGGAPTLPVVALQAHALDSFDRFVALLKEAGYETPGELPDHRSAMTSAVELWHVMQILRRAFTTDPVLSRRFLMVLAGDERL